MSPESSGCYKTIFLGAGAILFEPPPGFFFLTIYKEKRWENDARDLRILPAPGSIQIIKKNNKEMSPESSWCSRPLFPYRL